jgi:hypothetical protein
MMAPPRSETPGMVVTVVLLLLLLLFVVTDDNVRIPETQLLDTTTPGRGEAIVVNATRGVFMVRDTDTTPALLAMAPEASKRMHCFDRKATEFASDFFMTAIEVSGWRWLFLCGSSKMKRSVVWYDSVLMVDKSQNNRRKKRLVLIFLLWDIIIFSLPNPASDKDQ